MNDTDQKVKRKRNFKGSNSPRPHPLFPVVVFIYSGSPDYLACFTILFSVYSPTILRVKVKFVPKMSLLKSCEMPRVHSSAGHFRLDRLNPTVAEKVPDLNQDRRSREALLRVLLSCFRFCKLSVAAIFDH